MANPKHVLVFVTFRCRARDDEHSPLHLPLQSFGSAHVDHGTCWIGRYTYKSFCANGCSMGNETTTNAFPSIAFSQYLFLLLCYKWIPKFTATMSSAVVHAVLIICAFAYTWLRPDWPYVSGAAILLQTCQGIAFELIWLVITQLLGALLWTDEDQRITQVAKMSALYCGIGPALGALVVAFLVSSGEGNAAAELLLLQGFTLVFRCSVALTAASFVFSWGWSSSD